MPVIRSLRVAALAAAVLLAAVLPAAAVLGVVSPAPVPGSDPVLRTQPPGATALLYVVWLTR